MFFIFTYKETVREKDRAWISKRNTEFFKGNGIYIICNKNASAYIERREREREREGRFILLTSRESPYMYYAFPVKLNLEDRRGLCHANWVDPPPSAFLPNPNSIRFYMEPTCSPLPSLLCLLSSPVLLCESTSHRIQAPSDESFIQLLEKLRQHLFIRRRTCIYKNNYSKNNKQNTLSVEKNK